MKKRLNKSIIFMLVFASLFTTFVNASEVFIGTTSTVVNYRNPDTGEIDDYGTKDEALGGGMSRSIIEKTALVEQENGKTFVTFRITLLSEMQNIKFSVQQTKGDANSYKQVSYDIMKESSDSADFRVEVPSVDSNIRFDGYVIPMGRDVRFYFNASSSKTANDGGNFVVTVKIPEPEVIEPEVTEPEVLEPETTEPEVIEPEVIEPVITETKEEVAETVVEDEIIEEIPEEIEENEEEIEEIEEIEEENEEEILEEEISEEEILDEILENEEEIEEIEEVEENNENTSNSPMIIIGLAVLSAVIGGYIAFKMFKKKK